MQRVRKVRNTGDAFLDDALEKFKLAQEAWSTIHDQYVDDVLFAKGEQWDEQIRKRREAEGRSTLVVDKIGANIRYIVNNARMNIPSIATHPVTGGSNKNTAKIFDGIIKYIEYSSNSKEVYSNTLKQVCNGGIGAFRIVTELDRDNEVQIKLKKIKDPTTIYPDPNAELAGFEDMQYCFAVHWMTKEDFEANYPDAVDSPIADNSKAWYTKDKVQVAEYWYIEDGKVCMAIITGSEVLSRMEDYPGKYIPFVIGTGEEYTVEDVREFKSIVRDIKDQQRLLNYTKSEFADFLSRSAKQQFLISDKQLGPYQDVWNSANVSNFNYLPYVDGGTLPQRLDPPNAPQALQVASQEADMDIRSSIGIRDPLKDIPASQSGKAIGLQISEGNISIYNYYDSLHNCILVAGKILIDLIPKYYDDARIQQVMGEDGQVNAVKINGPYVENDQVVQHMLADGKYGIRLNFGPSYESQRTETADKLIELTQKYPQMMQLAGDIIVRNLNFAGAEELASRLQAAIPPQILAASNPTNGDDAKNKLMATQNQIAQMQEQMKMLQQENQQLKVEQKLHMQSEQQKHANAIELENLKFRNDLILREQDEKADIATEQADTNARLAEKHVDRQTKIFEKQLDHQHDLNKIAIQNANKPYTEQY